MFADCGDGAYEPDFFGAGKEEAYRASESAAAFAACGLIEFAKNVKGGEGGGSGGEVVAGEGVDIAFNELGLADVPDADIADGEIAPGLVWFGGQDPVIEGALGAFDFALNAGADGRGDGRCVGSGGGGRIGGGGCIGRCGWIDGDRRVGKVFVHDPATEGGFEFTFAQSFFDDESGVV